ncbi:Fic family protein [Aquimarina pacifica]|uniref:Fic family protein n=1 Tax=Aquimarina pacifica TaxID=1296415 RepID=UPI00046FA532|nr:Fic family protein [Aquimarina pacifica]
MEIVTKLSKELSFLKAIDVLKKEVDMYKPLPGELSNKIFQKLRLDWNYNSNAIEGNSFTFGETIALLMEGVTAKGKPLKDALDIKGHNEAIDFMMDMVKNDRGLTETDIRGLHSLVLGQEYYNAAITSNGQKTKKLIKKGEYKTSPNHVQTATGAIHYYATPEETPAKMKELVEWYNSIVDNDKVHPIVFASIFHHRFVAIHPFDDGNGRMTRILTNFILLKFGYPVSVIKQETKSEYYGCLSQADNGQLIPIIEYIANSVKDSLLIYSKALNGEDISEPDDLDKEITLFRKELGRKTKITEIKGSDSILNISFEVFSFLKEKLDRFSDLFYSTYEKINDNSGTINVSGDFLKNKDTYKKMVKDRYVNVNFITYNYDFRHNIHKDDKSIISIQLSIHFKEKNFIIGFGSDKLVKYYDEKNIDDNYINMVKNIVKHVMEHIKRINNN